MISKKLVFGLIAAVAFATPAAAQQSQTSVQKANTQNAAVNGSNALSITEQENQQVQLERNGFYHNYDPQQQLSIQESNTSNAAVNGSSAFSHTEQHNQQVQVDWSQPSFPFYK
jgi:Ni/Co efflux regulator RcnB